MRLLLLLLPLHSLACLPSPFYSPGYSPGYGGYYPPHPIYAPLAPRLGPFRAEPQGAVAAHSSPVHPHYSAQMDEAEYKPPTLSLLNCATFSDKCHWANSNDDELDWTTIQESAEAAQFLPALAVHNVPEQTAGALVSTSRKGWEGGQLVSDVLPCIGNGVRLTATVWKSRLGPLVEQPKLQICSKNQQDDKMPMVNCNEFEIRNGVPMTVQVPVPSDPMAPAQIVIYGNNFVAPEGGAIYIQDIVIDGPLTCHQEPLEHPVLVSDSQINELEAEKKAFDALGPLKALDGSAGLIAINQQTPEFDQLQRLQQIQQLQQQLAQQDQLSMNAEKSTSSVVEAVKKPQETVSNPSSLFESCLALSCNPSDLSCKFWRSAGNNRWEIGSSGRSANPLTGIYLAPGNAEKFLVAPFYDNHINSYTLVSESLNIMPLEEVYFCFYEYYATYGLSLSICTDKMDCFYKKNSLAMGDEKKENKKWHIRCAKLPVGKYEMRVIAENTGDNKGEVGFLPVRLSKDKNAVELLC